MTVYHKILVPLDASELSDRVLDVALATAAWSGAEVLLLSIHARPPGLSNAEAQQDLDVIEREVADLLTRARLRPDGPKVADRVSAEVHSGSLVDAISMAVESRHCDLVVMGMHGREGMVEWITGSTTEQVVRSVPASVFVVRPQGYPYLRN